MLETYFSASKMRGHLRSGPSGPYLDGFAEALDRQGSGGDRSATSAARRLPADGKAARTPQGRLVMVSRAGGKRFRNAIKSSQLPITGFAHKV